jgi:hypothetical protein
MDQKTKKTIIGGTALDFAQAGGPQEPIPAEGEASEDEKGGDNDE